MDHAIKEVAERIRAVREDVGLSVEEMAKRTDVTVEEYKALEAGQSDFSFTFIYKCAKACGVEITDVMEGESPKVTSYTVTRAGKGLPIVRREGFAYYRLAPQFRHKISEPFFVKIPYSEEAMEKPLHMASHVGQEFDIVVKGCMKIYIGDHSEILHPGDSIYYDSSTPHDEVAIGGEDCEIYAIVMNPNGQGGVPEYKEHVQTRVLTNVDKAGLVHPVSEKFVSTTTDEFGHLTGIEYHNTDTFNFGFDIVDKVAEKTPDKLAMLHVSNDFTERRFTFADMKHYSNMTANYFRSLGIKKGDRVMLVLKRHYQFWFSIVALHKLGAIAIPATNQLLEHDYVYRFDAAGVSAIVCTGDGDVTTHVEGAVKQCKSVKTLICTGGPRPGWHDFDGELPAYSDKFERTEDTSCGDDPILMFFTSGTTGYPKIATHSHKYGLGHFLTAKYWQNVDPNGLHFTISDTGWGKALWGKLYGQWMNEAPVFTYDFDRFDANKILPMFAKYHITTFCAPPTMFRFFIKEDLSKFDLSSLKYAVVAGEALNPEVYNRFLEATGIKLMEGFGQTETTLSIANFVGDSNKVGSMGRPSPLYDIDIVLPDGTPAKPGETGEIVIRTDKKVPCGLYLGYYNNEEKTKEAWHDGAYHTGDTAWRDEDGYFWYVGRVDDLIKSSGYRIGPFEIESVIMELPYVLECAITAAPDEIRGQVVKASIVLTKGTEASEALKKEIQNYVKEHTAPYKYPRIVEFMEELPKTISGKIRRVALRENSEKQK